MAEYPAVAPTNELGHAVGVAWTQGYPWDPSEATPELAWPFSVQVYDKMRRQDAQVISVLRAVTLPIQRNQWRIDPNGARPEVVQHVATDLGLAKLGDTSPAPAGRTRGKFKWEDHMRLALLSLVYGHMPFEKVFTIADDGLAHLEKLAPRMPATISKINIDRAGDLESIEQWPSGVPGDVGPNIVIPADRLVMYTHEREAGLWQGQSLLRSAYRPYLVKDRLIRVDAIKHERNGMGVPTIEAPQGATAKQMAELNQLAQSYRAGEASGGALPYGAKLVLTGTTGTLPDTLGSIRYHDEQIARMVLAQFLELVTSSHGSRALANSLIDFFILALQSTADEIAERATEDVIEELVEFNWGEDEQPPKVVPANIGDEHQVTAESLAALVTSGALQGDETLDAWIRENYRMPERTPGSYRTPSSAPAPPAPAPAAAGRDDPKAAARPSPGEHRAPKWPGRKYQEALTGHYGPRIAQATGALLKPQTVATDWHRLAANVEAGQVDEQAAAFVAIQQPDTTALGDVLAELYGDGYIAGTHAGDLSLKKVGVTPKPTPWSAPQVAAAGAEIDWSSWTPGQADAAAELAATDSSRGLANLLAEKDLTIRSVADTRMDELGNVLADGTRRGLSTRDLAGQIRDLLDNPDRADMIAETETARAVTVATLDQYAENGVPGKEWLLSDGACPLCEENDGAGVIDLFDDFPEGDAPVHPNCVCAVAPVVTEQPAADTGGDVPPPEEG